ESQDRTIVDFIRKNEGKKFRYVSGPNIDRTTDLVAREMLRENENDLESLLGFRHKDVVFGNTLFKNMGAASLKKFLTGPTWRRSGRGGLPRETTTTMATRTCSCLREWAIPSSTGGIT